MLVERVSICGLLAVLVSFCSCSRENDLWPGRIRQPVRNVIVIASVDDLAVANAIQANLLAHWGSSRLVTTSKAEEISATQRESISHAFQMKLNRIPLSVLPMTYPGIDGMQIDKVDDFDFYDEGSDSNKITNIEVWSPFYVASDKAVVVARYENGDIGDVTSAFLVSFVNNKWIVSHQYAMSCE